MELKNNTLLNSRFNIRQFIKKYDEYYLYLASDIKTGKNVVVTEYIPPNATKNSDGVLVIPIDEVAHFDKVVSAFTTSAQVAAGLEINSYLDIVSAFDQNGTGYVVHNSIEGRLLKDFIDFNHGPMDMEYGTLLFFQFLSAYSDAVENNGLFFNVNIDNIFVTEDLQLKIEHHFSFDYDKDKTMRNLVEIYSYLVTGQPIGKKDYSKHKDGNNFYNKYQDILKMTEAFDPTKFASISDFGRKLLGLFADDENPVPLIPIRERDLMFLPREESLPKESPRKIFDRKTILMNILTFFLIVFLTAVGSFYISKLLISNPFDTINTVDQNEYDRTIEIDK